MGKHRTPLPPVPLFELSRQQRLVYDLAASHSTREISRILSIPEKQVRQVYSVIRSKALKFANKNVPLATGAEPALDGCVGEDSCTPGIIRELVEDNGHINFSRNELFVMEHIKKGISIKEISRITGKSIQSVKKIRQRINKKLCQKGVYFDDNCTIKIDTGKTYVKINFNLIKSAMDRMKLSREQLARDTGIPPERLAEIESRGMLTYDELFLLARRLNFNPYGPAERDELLKKLSDTNWIRMIRSGVKRTGREKSRYRNRVMYYATARYYYDGGNRDKPVIEDGRNGLFPLALTRDQQAACRWFLNKYMLRPVYTYKYPGLGREIKQLENVLAGEKGQYECDKHRRKLLHLKEDIAPENGKSIFIINKSQMLAINKILFGPFNNKRGDLNEEKI
ncbi:MAG: helix-turn-helix domain-containing protein [Peptococcaceae bacterium]|nr:helix-turn-helix domain-containing protein [Peptococcaceae bacterium]